MQVDHQQATDLNVSLLLVGNDKAGSKVLLTVAKGGDKVFDHFNLRSSEGFLAANIWILIF